MHACSALKLLSKCKCDACLTFIFPCYNQNMFCPVNQLTASYCKASYWLCVMYQVHSSIDSLPVNFLMIFIIYRNKEKYFEIFQSAILEA